jgi:hypothetical protein
MYTSRFAESNANQTEKAGEPSKAVSSDVDAVRGPMGRSLWLDREVPLHRHEIKLAWNRTI